MRSLLLGSVLLITPCVLHSAAADFPQTDYETRESYRRLEAEYRTNPIWSNKSLNRYRDGKLSSYLPPKHAFQDQGKPLTAREIANLPEARFPSFALFNRAVRGMREILTAYPSLEIRNDLLTIVDFDQTTDARRFIVLDLERETIEFQTWVHHGLKSDANRDRLPELFSNIDNSNKSSAGFYLTEKNSYEGQWGHSVRLHGLDRGINSNIHARAIVMHPWLPLHARRLAARDPKQTSLGCLSLSYYESGKFQGLADQPIAHLIVDRLKGHSLIYVNTSRVDLEVASVYLNGKRTESTTEATLAQVTAEEGRVPLIDEALAYPDDDRLF